MDTQDLLQFKRNFEIEKRTTQSFWNCIKNYKKDDPKSFYEDYKNIIIEDIQVEFFKLSLNILFYDNIVENICAYLELYYMDEYLGKYFVDYSLDGEIIDDGFIS